MELAPGTHLGSYEIRHRIGAGGMGEVYFARDTKLGRFVALKLLLPELTADEDRLRRFGQEARATSALNHPNILTIFEIGREGELHYIVTEFIDGVTLRNQLMGEELALSAVLDICIQVAAALAAAHASGIVHRDIKPENIMLRPDGILKVLDFGLAKLMPMQDQRVADPNISTAPNINTDPGAVVGTVMYMSPEQLRGLKVDGRADIWSLGVVLYELLAGRTPFAGASKSDMIASILREDPPLLSRYCPDAPVELQRITEKCLRKNREDRYQIAKDLMIDLRDLKQELQVDAKLGRIRSSGAEDRPASSGSAQAHAAPGQLVSTKEVGSPRRTSGAEYVSGIFRDHFWATAVAAGIVAVGMLALIWVAVVRPPTKTTARAAVPSFSEVMSTSNAREAVISPDGKLVATVVEDAGKQLVRVQQLANPSQSLVLADGKDYRGLVYSHGSDQVFYLGHDDAANSLYQISVLGHAPRKLITGIDSPVSFAPGGSELVFVRKTASGPVLMRANSDGSEERQIAAGTRDYDLGTYVSLNNGPAWSPDGSVIAAPVTDKNEAALMRVLLIGSQDGSRRLLGSRQWYLIGRLSWLGDGSGLLMDAQEKRPPLSTPQIWQVSYPSGESRAITNDLTYYKGISVTANDGALITTQRTQTSKLWIVNGGQTREVADSRNKGSSGIAWTGDGKIIYASHETGLPELWVMDGTGNNSRQLTFDNRINAQPAVSRASPTEVVFASYGEGTPHIWRLNLTSGQSKQLTNAGYEDSPDYSPDGKMVIFHSETSGVDHGWRLSLDDNRLAPLSDLQVRHPVYSPDGKRIACFTSDGGGAWRLTIQEAQGGKQIQSFDIPASVAMQWHGARWTSDGQGISYVVTSGGVSNIWIQSLNSKEAAKPWTDFKADQIIAFAWSRDGKSLAVVRATESKRLVLIRDFR